jgi:polyhydroxyalkanoate synthase subunit PhaC
VSLRDDALRQVSLLGERSLHWVSNAIERRRHSENFIVAGLTPFATIHTDGLMSVRRYASLSEDEIAVGEHTRPVVRATHRIPVVLVPPLAATSLNFDLLPNRSLVKFLLSYGFRVYLVDWGDPQADHHHLGLAHYTTRMLPEALAKVREDSGEQDLSLFGYCMGGLFCLIYAGWSQDAQIRNIVTVASPIDSHQVGVAGKLLQMMDVPLRALPLTVPAVRKLPFHGLPVDPRWLRVPGWMSAAAFKLTNPLGTLQGYLDLLMNLWDRDYVTEYQTMATWFNRMHDYPGGIVQDAAAGDRRQRRPHRQHRRGTQGARHRRQPGQGLRDRAGRPCRRVRRLARTGDDLDARRRLAVAPFELNKSPAQGRESTFFNDLAQGRSLRVLAAPGPID